MVLTHQRDAADGLTRHHRVEAELPGWVIDMDDDEAFMQLVLANTQGELSPLEIGMHALHAVPRSKGGRGVTGGLSEYAKRVGHTGEYIGQLRSAATVLDETPNSSLEFVADKAKHLYEISKAPRECWPALISSLVDSGWTVEQTAGHVATVKDFAAGIPDVLADWLPLTDVVQRHHHRQHPAWTPERPRSHLGQRSGAGAFRRC